MKTLLSIVSFVLLSQLAYSQSVNDVLMSGIPLRNNVDLFIAIDNNNVLKYSQGNLQPSNLLRPVDRDSTLFLLKGYTQIHIYAAPLNPLKFSYSEKTSFYDDLLDKKASDALQDIVSFLSTVTELAAGGESKDDVRTKIRADLARDISGEILRNFQALSEISFSDAVSTRTAIDKAALDTGTIATYFSDFKQHIKDLKDHISTELPKREIVVSGVTYDVAYTDVEKQSLSNSDEELKNTISVYNGRLKAFLKLSMIYQALETYYTNVNESTSEKPSWWTLLQTVPLVQGKITIEEITKNRSGFEIKDGQIVELTNISKLKTLYIRFRKFQKFVPEVSLGIAYTNLSFPKFGATADSTGQHYVSSAGEDVIKKLNVNAMLNLNYVTPYWGFNPLIQIGIGTNIQNPVLLGGLGIRFPLKGIGHFALSGGVAFSWIKNLTKLKIGDSVGGEADVEADLKYEFRSTPSYYFGVQIEL